MAWTAELPFDQSCKALYEQGWSVREIASYEECPEAKVRKALGFDEPQQPKGAGLLPYLGI